MPIPPRTEDWEQPDEAEGIEPFISNLLQIVERDQEAAHAAAGRGEELEPYAVFNVTRRLNQAWPAFSAIARREEEPPDETAAFVRRNTAELEIEVKGPDPNGLARELMRRVRAAKWMIKKGRIEDYTADMGSDFGGMVISVTPAVYTSFIDKTRSMYTQIATMTVTQELLEA